MRNLILGTLSLLSIGLSTLTIYFNSVLLASFAVISIVMLGWALHNTLQTKHTILRNFPIIGALRWVFEAQRDKIRQYFNEGDLDEFPISRRKRSRVYQRSKNEQDTTAFGTIQDVNREGYESIQHSMFPKDVKDVSGIRIKIGGRDCLQPVSTSILNISAMSYGALSGAAIRALNKGAKEGNFLHNTGEGGISKHHLQGGGLIFQVGTGYFGCGITGDDGKRQFDEGTFKVNAALNAVKMIEIKMSQGAKPGHGGILPAKKNTPEIAEIRNVEVGTTVHSPSYHTAFTNYDELTMFIKKLRDLSKGKPIGIKFCLGSRVEFNQMVRAFKRNDIFPDYIAIDGSEGGTGSAPLEYADHVGMPLTHALIYVNEMLKMANLRDDIKILASGKIIDTFDIVKYMSLGADAVYMARAFMFSLGCIQARECNKDTCPVGVATQDKKLERGLVVEDKYKRVYNFHHNTLIALIEMVATMGLTRISDVNPHMINVNHNNTLTTLGDLYKIENF